MERRTLEFEVDVSFVTDEEIAVLNRDYRNKPRPTDVLSFAQSEGDFPDTGFASGAFDSDSAGQARDATDGFAGFEVQEAASWMLGDIVISIETAWRQARERDHDLEIEVSFLLVHGALHLLGYDHATSSGRRAMWKQQDTIVERLAEQLAPTTKEVR